MILERVYICDLCKKRFSMSFDTYRPNHLIMRNYEPGESTVAQSEEEYELCESCAYAIRKVINERKK